VPTSSYSPLCGKHSLVLIGAGAILQTEERLFSLTCLIEKRRRKCLAMKKAIVLGLVSAMLGVWATPASARMVTVSGSVVSIQGDDFTLDTGKEKILVDADSEGNNPINLSVGERVTVYGDFDDYDLDAYTITRSDGSVIQIDD
jgi:hypothetical protein